MRVAAIQFAPVFLNKEANLRKIALLVSQAAKAGARVAVLPELCTTGYSFMSGEEAEAEAEAVSPEGRTTSVMLRLAHAYNVVVAWGMVELDPGTKSLHNSQIMVTPRDGYVSYRKANLWGNDFLWAKPGRASPPILRTSFASFERRLGLLICRDVRDKSSDIVDFYEKGDADMVLMGANWGRGGFPATAWMEFVRSNSTSLIVANRFGTESHNDFGFGGSCIIHPDGSVSTEGLVMGQDCIVTGDVL